MAITTILGLISESFMASRLDCVSEVEKQTIPHGMREIHFNTHVVNSNVLNQFVTDENKNVQ